MIFLIDLHEDEIIMAFTLSVTFMVQTKEKINESVTTNTFMVRPKEKISESVATKDYFCSREKKERKNTAGKYCCN